VLNGNLRLLLFAALTTGCPAPQPHTVVTWEPAFDTTELGSASGVWGSGPDDVFVVGGADKGAVFHFDGTSWSKMVIPDVPLLVWAYGFGPNDVFVVGTGGGVLHWDGQVWTRLDSGTTKALWGVFGLRRDDLWIVGGDPFAGEPMLLHYDGASFTQVQLEPAQNPMHATSLFKVWGIGTRLFAVGQRGLLLEYVNGAWVYRPAGANADDDFVSLWGTSETDIVVVGGRSNARVALYDGNTWNTLAPYALAGLNAVFVLPNGDVFAGGLQGTAGKVDRATGAIAAEKTGTWIDLHAMWADAQGRLFAVGGTFVAPHKGVALVRTEKQVVAP
jgi:hypothetical protein